MKRSRAWGIFSGAIVSVVVIALGWDAAFASLLVSSGVMYAGL
jgi:hypothetical protein